MKHFLTTLLFSLTCLYSTFCQNSLNDLNIILKHDFEKNTIGNYLVSEFTEDWNASSSNLQRCKIVANSNDSQNDSKVLRISFPQGSLGPDEGGIQWHTMLGKTYDEIYISYDIRFMKDFQFQLGGKIPSIASGNIFDGNNFTRPTGYDGFTAGMMFGIDGSIKFYPYFPDSYMDKYGDTYVWGFDYEKVNCCSPSHIEFPFTTGKMVYFVPGQWHNITYRLVANTVRKTTTGTTGNYDGILEAYFDGELVSQANHILFRHTTEIGIDRFRMVTFFGGSSDDWRNPIPQWLEVDNVLLFNFKDTVNLPVGNELSKTDRRINYWRIFSTLTTIPPNPPSGLMVQSKTSSNITLKWTDNAKNELGYEIYRSPTSADGFTLIKTMAANATTFTDNSLQANTKYYYRIRSYNNAGYSEFTDILSAATLPLQPPSAPSSLLVSARTKSSISISWTDNASNEQGFRVYRSLSAASGFTEIASVAANAVYFTDNSLQPNTTYYYQLRAFNQDGYSAYTSAVQALTLPLEIPSAPGNLIASQIGYTSVKLLWKDNSSNETGFELERSGPNNMTEKKILSVPFNKLEYFDNTLAINSKYQYRIRSKNLDGVSAWSNTIEIVTPNVQIPAAPTHLKSTEFTDKSISVVWDDNSNNEDAFIVTRSLAIDPTNLHEFRTRPNDTVFTDTSLTSQTTYLYVVKACNVAGISTTSNKNVATTLSTAELKRVKTGLIAYYNFGFNPDYVVYDQSGFDNPLNLQVLNRSAVRWNNDHTLEILGNTALVSIEPAIKIIRSIKKTNEITFECWIKPEEPTFSEARIISLSKDDNHVGFLVDQMYKDEENDKALSYSVRMQTSSTTESGYPEYMPRKTQRFLNLEHLVYVRDSIGMERFYLNGEKSQENYRPSDLSNWDDNFHLRLGNENDMNHLWKGSFYSVALYNMALSPQQVSVNYNAGPCDSLNSEKLNYQIIAYPNPVVDKVTVQLVPENIPDIVEHTYYRIVDILGNILYEVTVFNPNDMYTKDFDLSHLPSGVYFLQVVSGKTQKSIKLIVKH